MAVTVELELERELPDPHSILLCMRLESLGFVIVYASPVIAAGLAWTLLSRGNLTNRST